jgi:hypothetical protein
VQFQYTLSEYTLKGERKATLKLDPNIDYVIQVIAREDKGDVGIDYKYSDMITSQSTNSLRLHTKLELFLILNISFSYFGIWWSLNICYDFFLIVQNWENKFRIGQRIFFWTIMKKKAQFWAVEKNYQKINH